MQFSEIARRLNLNLDEVLAAYYSGVRKLRIKMERLKNNQPEVYCALRAKLRLQADDPCRLVPSSTEAPDDYEQEVNDLYGDFYAD